MKKYICQSCGGDLVLRENNFWECPYCHSLWQDETVRHDAEEILKIVGDYNEAQKAELVSNIRRQLYDAINEQYTDSEKIISLCRRLKEYLPEDFMANFYEAVNSQSHREVAELINDIEPEEHGAYIEGILKFMIKSFVSEFHLPLVNLIERAYGEDNVKFEKYHTMVQEIAQKVNDGVYETSLSRDVFVAYSSKDMETVYDLVSYLEESGLTCFVAARNLRHGIGAVQNYNKAIEEAIRNCRVFVLVSTPNSRNFSCDTLAFELPTLKTIDIELAPPEFRQSYETMPVEYKKHRVEYRVKNSKLPSGADNEVKKIFNGCEYAKSPEEVANRIAKFKEEDILRGTKTEEGPKGYVAPAPINNEIEALFENIKVHFDFN